MNKPKPTVNPTTTRKSIKERGELAMENRGRERRKEREHIRENGGKEREKNRRNEIKRSKKGLYSRLENNKKLDEE